MAAWHEYTCLECGHGGLTRNPEQYRRGRAQCPRCGSIRFEVQERGLAPLPEEDGVPEVED